MWAIAAVLIVVLDIWIIFMQLKQLWLSNKKNKKKKKEGFMVFGGVQEELEALQRELAIIEEQVIKNTAMAQQCEAVAGAKFAEIKKEKAAMQKKLIAARQGKVPKPPWPGVAPPSSMLPVPIQ